MSSPREKEPLEKAFEAIFDSFMRGKVHICLPGIVTSFTADGDGVRASVQPALQRLYKGQDEPQNLAILDNIPVVYPSSNDFGVVVELREGDEVALFFGERSMATWLETGGLVLPDDPRYLDLSDAFVMPGLHSKAHPVTSVEPGITLKKFDESVSLNLNDDQITARVGATDFEITDGSIKAKPTAIVPTATDVKGYQPLVVAPAVAPGYVSLVDHVHQVTAVGSPTLPAAPTEIGPP